MVTQDRVEECARIQSSIADWAWRQDDILAAAVVGSWARGGARMDSDLDLVVLALQPDRYVGDARWLPVALGQDADLVRTRTWGPLTEQRVRVASKLEVELGFAAPSWAATDPVDPGTARVVVDGCQPLVDRAELLARLIAAVEQQRRLAATPTVGRG